MYIYYLFMLIMIILSLMYQKNNNSKTRNMLFFIIFLSIFLFSALRYNVGADYSRGYIPGYYSIRAGYDSYYEILFLLLNKFVIRFFDNVDWLFIISSFLTFFFLFKTLKKESSNFFISMIVLFASRFYLYSFGQVRQYIAISIFIYSIQYIIKGDWKKYFLFILIAYGFHKTSIIYFFIYFLRYLKINKKQYTILIIAAPLLTPIVNFFYRSIGMQLYSSYIVNRIGAGETPIVFIATALIFTIIPLFVYKNIDINPKNQIYINIQIFVWVLVMTVSSINESYRIIGMFIYISLLLLPECYNNANKKIKLLILVLLIGMIIYTSYLMFVYPGSSLIPYQTIFNK